MLKTLAILLALSSSPFDIDPADLYGEWVGVGSDDASQEHRYLRLESNHAGRFVYVSRGRAIVDFEFSESQVADRHGYLEISQTFDGWGVKVLLSGVKSGEDRGFGHMHGVMYMYQVTPDRSHLFNTLIVDLWAHDGPVPSDLADRNSLDEVRELYSSEQ